MGVKENFFVAEHSDMDLLKQKTHSVFLFFFFSSQSTYIQKTVTKGGIGTVKKASVGTVTETSVGTVHKLRLER